MEPPPPPPEEAEILTLQEAGMTDAASPFTLHEAMLDPKAE